VVDALVTGVHEPGTSHRHLLGAFAGGSVLRRMHAALAQSGYRSHEFGDSVLLARIRRCCGNRCLGRRRAGTVPKAGRPGHDPWPRIVSR
jgi:hypothetical protein